MTRAEAERLDQLIAEFREFREDDRDWKNDHGPRLRRVEVYVAGQEAIEEKEKARGVSRRAYVAAAVAAAGIVVSICLNVINLLV